MVFSLSCAMVELNRRSPVGLASGVVLRARAVGSRNGLRWTVESTLAWWCDEPPDEIPAVRLSPPVVRQRGANRS